MLFQSVSTGLSGTVAQVLGNNPRRKAIIIKPYLANSAAWTFMSMGISASLAAGLGILNWSNNVLVSSFSPDLGLVILDRDQVGEIVCQPWYAILDGGTVTLTVTEIFYEAGEAPWECD